MMKTICCIAAFFLLCAEITVAEAAQKDNSSEKINVSVARNAVAANTDIPNYPTFKIGGFGSLGISHSSQNLGDYIIDSTMPDGAGRSNEWSASNNSKIAVHLNANFTPKVSAVLQVISEYNADGTFRPEMEWANVKYSFNRDAYVRAGRIVLPTFMDSENRDVGFSFPWVHPPVDLYHQLSIPSSDGVDAMYHFDVGDTANSIKAIYGTNTLDRPTSVSTSRNLWGIFETLEYGPTTYHVSYQRRNSSTFSQLTGVTGAWTENSDLSVGANYDPGDWFVMSEWIQRRSTYKAGAMYISTGYRINKFTPYLTHSQNSRGSFLPGYPTTSIGARRYQSTNTLGVRWDFMKNTDFKIQYDYVTLGADSNGYLINVPTGVILHGSSFHVISAIVDFVF